MVFPARSSAGRGHDPAHDTADKHLDSDFYGHAGAVGFKPQSELSILIFFKKALDIFHIRLHNVSVVIRTVKLDPFSTQ